MVCAGGIDADLADFYELAGVTVLEAYGRPETAGAVCVAARPGERAAGRPAAAWAPRCASPTRARSRSPGPGVMDGYHGRRADTEAVLDQGWLRTGDAGLLDEEGRLRVFGRHVAPDERSDPAGSRSLATRA